LFGRSCYRWVLLGQVTTTSDVLAVLSARVAGWRSARAVGARRRGRRGTVGVAVDVEVPTGVVPVAAGIVAVAEAPVAVGVAGVAGAVAVGVAGAVAVGVAAVVVAGQVVMPAVGLPARP